MSHFVQIQTQIRELVLLERALDKLKYSYKKGQDIQVRGYQGNSNSAELVVDTGSNYDIGFRKIGETFSIIADWYEISRSTSLGQEQFVQQVQSTYAFELIREHAAEHSLIWESEEVLEDGNTVIILSERG